MYAAVRDVIFFPDIAWNNEIRTSLLAAACPVLFQERTASTSLHHYTEFCPHYTFWTSYVSCRRKGTVIQRAHSSAPELKRGYHANVLLFRFYWQLQQHTMFVVTQAWYPTY